VTCYDAHPGKGDEAAAEVATFLRATAAKGKLSQAECDAAVARITVTTSLDAVADSDIVIEAIVEDLDAKQALLARLGPSSLRKRYSPPTRHPSWFRRSQRGASIRNASPGCIFSTRYLSCGWSKSSLALRTGEGVVERLTEFVKRLGHVPVFAVDSPGFLVNHIGRGLYTEGIRVVSEGVAAASEVTASRATSWAFAWDPSSSST
jgi:3-hydroxybutyryl-CoA dehydrogenase